MSNPNYNSYLAQSNSQPVFSGNMNDDLSNKISNTASNLSANNLSFERPHSSNYSHLDNFSKPYQYFHQDLINLTVKDPNIQNNHNFNNTSGLSSASSNSQTFKRSDDHNNILVQNLNGSCIDQANLPINTVNQDICMPLSYDKSINNIHNFSNTYLFSKQNQQQTIYSDSRYSINQSALKSPQNITESHSIMPQNLMNRNYFNTNSAYIHPTSQKNIFNQTENLNDSYNLKPNFQGTPFNQTTFNTYANSLSIQSFTDATLRLPVNHTNPLLAPFAPATNPLHNSNFVTNYVPASTSHSIMTNYNSVNRSTITSSFCPTPSNITTHVPTFNTQSIKHPVAHSEKSNENLVEENSMMNYTGSQYPQLPASLSCSLNSLNLQHAQIPLKNLDLLHEKNIYPIIETALPKPLINSKTPNSDPEIMCCTLNCVPNTNSLLQKSRLPLGLIIQPFKDINNLPVIHSNVIVRCRSCRTYINPFVIFLDPSRWKCNVCFKVNDLPTDFCYDQALKRYIEPHNKSEMRFASVEHIAPSDYMLRPPQPAVYIFLLDVSFNAIEIGYLEIFTQVLLSELDNLRGDSRTKIGFITYDSSITFYDLSEDLPQPHIYMCPDLEEVYLPCPEGLLVNIASCRNQVIHLLEQLGRLHSNNTNTYSALSSALQAAYKLLSPTGGRITVFNTQLSTIGSAPLSNREDPNQRIGNSVSGLNPVTDFYKRFALECSAQQIAVDIFSLNSQYTDLSTIGCASKFSSGSLYYFGGFHATANTIETQRFVGQLRRYLTRNIGFESVMRVRCTKGISIRAFHGNCFVRSTDLLALPNVNSDAGFALHLHIDDNIESNFVSFQTALLYTSTNAERRIRVHTLCLPVTSNQVDIYPAVNQFAITALLARMAVDKCLNQCLLDARDALVNSIVDMLRAYASCMNLSLSSHQLQAPHTISLLPTYALALLKSIGLRTNISTKLDERIDALELMKNMPIKQLLLFIYPHLYPIHIWDKNFLVKCEIKGVLVPPMLPLSWMQIDKFGAYLLDIGRYLFIYLGIDVNPEFLNDLFAIQSINQLNEGPIELPLLNTQISNNIREFLEIRNDLKAFAAPTILIKSNGNLKDLFANYMIDDKTEATFSYLEFLQHIHKEIKT